MFRDTYAAQAAWAPRHVGKELRLSRLGAFDAALGAIRADAEAQAARKTGDHDRAARHEHLAASYRAMRDHYQHQQRAFARAMADRQEWDQATAGSRRLAIAADAKLAAATPSPKIEPLRSTEQDPLSYIERERPHPTLESELTEHGTWIHDMYAKHQAFRARVDARQPLTPPSEKLDWAELDQNPPSLCLRRDAILQSPKPQITPSARILQHFAEHDTEPEAAG